MQGTNKHVFLRGPSFLFVFFVVCFFATLPGSYLRIFYTKCIFCEKPQPSFLIHFQGLGSPRRLDSLMWRLFLCSSLLRFRGLIRGTIFVYRFMNYVFCLSRPVFSCWLCNFRPFVTAIGGGGRPCGVLDSTNLRGAGYETNSITPCYYGMRRVFRSSPPAAGSLAAGFLVFGCGLLHCILRVHVCFVFHGFRERHKSQK